MLTLLAVSVLAVPPQHGGEQQQQSQTCPHGALLALCCRVLRSNLLEFNSFGTNLAFYLAQCSHTVMGRAFRQPLEAFLFHHISIFILLIRCPLEYCGNHVCSLLQLSEEARTHHITRPYTENHMTTSH